MANITSISGAYTATLDGDSVGVVQDGFLLRYIPYSEQITADYFGQTRIEDIHQGADLYVEFTTLEFQEFLDTDNFFPQFTHTLKTPTNFIADVGEAWEALAKQLVLTPTAGKSQDKIWTFYKALLVSDVDLLLSSRLTRLPLSFYIYPDNTHAYATHTVST